MKLCVVSPNKGVYSETFIKAHIDLLPFEVTPLYGWSAPFQDGEGRFIGSKVAFLDRQLKKLSMHSNSRKLADLSLAKWLKKKEIDCVLVEYGSAGVQFVDICERAEIPVFVHFHGADASHGPTLEAHLDTYPKLFKKAVKIFSVSRAMTETLAALGCPREKIILNPYGADPALFESTSPAFAPADFLAVGRFCEKKAPFLTLLAFAEAHKKRPAIKLKMAGDGFLLDSCKTLAKALKISSKVNFLGACPHESIPSLMAQTRAFLQHSVVSENGDSEGTPVAIIEAQMSGLPVVSTRHAGIPDVVMDGETGFLVDEGDVSAMADAIVRLADQPDLAGEIGAAARRRATRMFTLHQHIERLGAEIQMTLT